jgi:ABC-2 type transport system permease protein
MSGAVFMETLRRTWRSTLYWGIGLAGYAVYLVSIVQDVDMLRQYGDLLQNKMPKVMLQAMGISDAAVMATPEGFIGIGFFTYVLLMLAVYGVLAGLNITANEEDQGIMDVVLSLPLPRWRVIMEKFAVYVVSIIVIVGLAFIGLVIGTQTSSVLKVDIGKLAQGSVNLILPTLLITAVTAFAATLVRRKGTATAIAAVFIVGSFFINFLGSAASDSSAAILKNLSFFHYADSANVIAHRLAFGNILLLLTVVVLLVGSTVWAFERRDVGV